MKKTFSKKYMQQNCGCYSIEKMENIFFSSGNTSIAIDDIINSQIPLKDKFWFVCKKTDLTISQKQYITISVAEIVLPIYEIKYPNDKRPYEAIQAAKQYIGGHISWEKLIESRRAAYAAAYAAYAAAYAAYAADVAAYAAAYAAYVAAYAAAYAAYAAAYAAADAAAAAADDAAADDAAIEKQLFDFLTDFINKN